MDLPAGDTFPRADRALTLAALAALALLAALDPRAHPRTATAVAAVAVAIALAAVRVGRAPGRAVAVLAAWLAVAARVGSLWQLAMLAALAGYAGTRRLAPALELPHVVSAAGYVPARWTALVGGVTPGALGAWLALAAPDIRDITGSELLRVPFALLVLGGVVFAVLNAALEELIWRGVFQTALEAAWGARAALALQALSFGAQHAHGFPRGVTGVVLAGTWGVMLGLLRRHARGWLAPVLAHVVADATIAGLVISRLR